MGRIIGGTAALLGAMLVVEVPTAATAQVGHGRATPDLIRLCGWTASGSRPQLQSLIRSQAGVEEQDSPEVVRGKVQNWWSATGRHVGCRGGRFRDMNLIKYAVYNNFTGFIQDLALHWRVDLNSLDSSDGRSALDYIDDEMVGREGSSQHNNLRRYHEVLTRAGALNRVEIDGVDCRGPRERRHRRCPARE